MRHSLKLATLLLVLPLLASAAIDSKWRLQFSGNARTAGHITLELTPEQREPVRATIEIAAGRSENGVARDVRDGLRAQLGEQFHFEVDDGEDVLVKRRRGEPKFGLAVVENTVEGIRIRPDQE